MFFFYPRFAQGLQLRQLDLITDGIAASSKTLTSMTKILRKVGALAALLEARYVSVICEYTL